MILRQMKGAISAAAVGLAVAGSWSAGGCDSGGQAGLRPQATPPPTPASSEVPILNTGSSSIATTATATATVDSPPPVPSTASVTAPAPPPDAELLSAATIAKKSCGELNQLYGVQRRAAKVCAVAADCSTLQVESLICPGCQSHFNPGTTGLRNMRALEKAFQSKKCSLAPCTPPRCEHLSVDCVAGQCVTKQF